MIVIAIGVHMLKAARSGEGVAFMAVELKPIHALALWHDVVLKTVRADGPDLSQRQMAIMTQVYLTPPPHTVRGLAAILNVSKPAITRALDTLGQMGLLKRRRDEQDRRNVLIQRTVKGSVFLTDLGELIAKSASNLNP